MEGIIEVEAPLHKNWQMGFLLIYIAREKGNPVSFARPAPEIQGQGASNITLNLRAKPEILNTRSTISLKIDLYKAQYLPCRWAHRLHLD